MYSLYQPVLLASLGRRVGTGWLPPLPDLRDYTEKADKIQPMAQKIVRRQPRGSGLPDKVDLRKWCSPVEDQGELGSCTAHAAVGAVEYFEKRAFGKHMEGSRLFVYKATRNLLKKTGDSGAWLRNAIGALVLCGVPPEKYWPYTDRDPEFDREPSSFVYAVADNFETLSYFRHDPEGSDPGPEKVLASVQKYLAAGVPSLFAFYGFPSFEQAAAPGEIPFPGSGEKAEWAHAVLAVGYDQGRKIKNLRTGKETKGALLFRNSWGKAWGEEGYGWIPFEYLNKKLARDFWSILGMNYVETGKFGFE